MNQQYNNNGIFTNIYSSIIYFDEINRSSKIGSFLIKLYKKRLLKSMKKIKKIPLSIPVLNDLVTFSNITGLFDCNEDVDIKRITIKETDKYGTVYIKFNMYDSKINVTSFNKTNRNKRCYMRRNEDFQYQIIEGKDPDINEIIEYIRSTIYRMICDYIRRS